MDSGTEEFNLTREQKSRLLRLARGSQPEVCTPSKKQPKMDMLYDMLKLPLPVNPEVVNSLPAVVRGLSSKLHSLAGRPIGDLLQDPTTDLATLVRIKEYAKQSGTSADSEEKSEVLLAVYYAAIASALVFHNKKITQHSHADLEQFFCSLAKNDWVLDELASLFARARASCLEKSQQKNQGSR